MVDKYGQRHDASLVLMYALWPHYSAGEEARYTFKGQKKLYQLSLFPILPAISCERSF